MKQSVSTLTVTKSDAVVVKELTRGATLLITNDSSNRLRRSLLHQINFDLHAMIPLKTNNSSDRSQLEGTWISRGTNLNRGSSRWAMKLPRSMTTSLVWPLGSSFGFQAHRKEWKIPFASMVKHLLCTCDSLPL
jgi:hypothetical protein